MAVLRRRLAQAEEGWAGRVEIAAVDMRRLRTPRLSDILVRPCSTILRCDVVCIGPPLVSADCCEVWPCAAPQMTRLLLLGRLPAFTDLSGAISRYDTPFSGYVWCVLAPANEAAAAPTFAAARQQCRVSLYARYVSSARTVQTS